MIRATVSKIAFMLLVVIVAGPAHADVGSAFDALVDGRSYRKNLRLQVRDTMVHNFLVAEPPALRLAIDEAIAVRLDVDSTANDKADARIIGWESLEALLYGYHSAGNRDLLKGTRISFPASLGVIEDRNPPVGVFSNELSENNDLLEDLGSSIQALLYAELYFRQAIKEAIGFIQSDPGGQIRATDLNPNAGPSLPNFTRWTIYLRHLEDAITDNELTFNNEDDQWSLTGAALLGKSIRRYGGTAVTIADKLWRSAYFHPAVANSREQLLSEAAEHLRCHIHGQFLASLPVAATLHDGISSAPGEDGSVVLQRNEYQEVGADVVRVNITAAQILAGRISRGERPKRVDLVPRWDDAAVNTQLSKLSGIRASLSQAWADAETAINENNSAIISATQDRLLRRDRYKFRLWQITGIHPDSDPDFDGLNSEDGRENYLRFVEDWVLDKTANFNPLDEWFNVPLTGFNDPAGGGSVSQISDLGLASLRMMQAFNAVNVAQARINVIPQRIRIEDERNGKVNRIVTKQGDQITALDMAVAAAEFITVNVCACGLSSGTVTTVSQKAFTQYAQAPIRNMINTTATVGVNNTNSQAVIENLLIEQGILIEELPTSIIQAQLAVAEVKRLGAEVAQLVEDYQYHVDGTANLWYNDPELVFEKAAAEKRYEELVRTFQGELYILAKMLEKAWVEPYENPVLNSSGAYEQFGVDPRFDLFPDAESIFAVGDHLKSADFWAALKQWNNYLANGRRGSVIGGRSSSIDGAVKISLRQHILGLTDCFFNQETGNFEVDEILRHENVRKFRAHVLRQAEAAQEEGFEIRFDFPINLTQLVEVEGQSEPLFLFGSLGVANPNIWNRRVLGVGIQLVGTNVTQGTIGIGGQVPVSAYLHGTISRESKFLDSIFTQNNRTIRTDLAQFQHDPFELTILGTDSVFAIEELRAKADGEQPDPNNLFQVPHVEWPLACDNWVLLIRKGVAEFNWENLDDINLYIFWEAGPPVDLSNNYSWPNDI